MNLPSHNKANIILVEDDERLAGLIVEYLEQHELEVNVEYRGDTAVKKIIESNPDLVILDVMLPGMDGLQVCKFVRQEIDCPIIMLTAKTDDIDQVLGLEFGADDYITKPVQPRVLLARIRALLRRTSTLNHSNKNQALANNELTFNEIRINKTSRQLYIHDKPIELTNTEFELLWLLANNAGEILSRDKILASLRGIGYNGLNRSTDITISRLRKKLGDTDQSSQKIKTVHRKGYMFVVENQ
ncbi:Transcriptional regulatory protein RstA [hydrothermal vent metagenome]|uniref:Transcriptional regulatory protein RstA n=1 Tax=hydrothermal vent metagenome TaxID=652676 RepID=A0A3B1AK65_9ZZZZ